MITFIHVYISRKFTLRSFYVPQFTEELTFEKFQRSCGTWLCIPCRMVYTYIYISERLLCGHFIYHNSLKS